MSLSVTPDQEKDEIISTKKIDGCWKKREMGKNRILEGMNNREYLVYCF